MKDYTLKKSEKTEYITNIKKKPDGTLEVTFADGHVFKNIEANEENIAKINERQEKQALETVINSEKLVAKRKKMLGYAAYKVMGGVSLSVISAGIIVSSTQTTPTPINILGFGTLSLIGIIPAIKTCIREQSKKKELDKIEYRAAHQTQLENFGNYPNALSSIYMSKVKRFETEQDPFSIMNIDTYTKKDLEAIVSNVEREESFGFTYQKQPLKKTK